MQKLSNFVPALSHHLKPLMRDGSQFTGVLFHPRIDSGIPLDSAVESQQFRPLHRFLIIIQRRWINLRAGLSIVDCEGAGGGTGRSGCSALRPLADIYFSEKHVPARTASVQ